MAKNPRIKYDVSVNVKPLVDGVRVAGKSLDDLKRRTGRASKATQKATRETKKFKDAWDGVKKLGAGSGTVLGQLTADVGDLGEGMAEVGAAAGPMVAALGTLGIGLVGTAAGLAAAVAVSVEIGRAWRDLTVRAVDLAEKMGKIPDAELIAAGRASARLDDAFADLTVTVATGLAPEFQDLATDVAAVVFGISALVEEAGKVRDTIGPALELGLALGTNGLSGIAMSAANSLKELGEEGHAQAETAAMLADNLDEVRDALEGARDRTKALREEMEQINEIRFKPFDQIVDGEIQYKQSMKDVVNHTQDGVDEMDAILADHEAAYLHSAGVRQDAANRAAEADRARAESAVVTGVREAQALKSLAIDVLQTRIDALDTNTKEGRKAAMEMFAVQKALAISQVVVSTALSVMQNASAYPMPWALIPMGVAATIGTAHAAMIAAEQPSFPSGGIVPQGMQGSQSSSSDHRAVQVMSREAILNRRATERLGERGVADLNAGGSVGGGAAVVVMQYRHRVFDEFVADNLAHRGPLAQAIDRGRRYGRS